MSTETGHSTFRRNVTDGDEDMAPQKPPRRDNTSLVRNNSDEAAKAALKAERDRIMMVNDEPENYEESSEQALKVGNPTNEVIEAAHTGIARPPSDPQPNFPAEIQQAENLSDVALTNSNDDASNINNNDDDDNDDMNNDTNGDVAAPLEAELAPQEDDVEARVAERLEQELNSRLQKVVQDRLQGDANRPVVVAEAVSVDNKDEENENADDDNRSFLGKYCVYIVGLLLLVAGAVVAVILITGGGDDADEPTIAGGGSVNPPTPATMPPIMAPTPAPTPGTPNPTQTPSMNPTFSRRGTLINLLQINGLDEYMDPTSDFYLDDSPQAEAIEWLVDQDPAQLDFELAAISEIIERYALAVFYFATNGKSWTDQVEFLTGSNVCVWFDVINEEESIGILCDMAASVTRLVLPNNNLVGTIPKEIGLLRNLEQVRLGDNSLLGPIPVEMGNLEFLSLLWLEKNVLSGSISPEFGAWTDLFSLDLENNLLEGSLPSEIGMWTNMEFFNLLTNYFEGSLPSEIGLWEECFYVDVDTNRFSGMLPSEIGNMESLANFYGEINQFTGRLPSELGKLSSLEKLFLFSNEFTGQVPLELSSLTFLEVMYLDSTNITGTLDPVFCIAPRVEWQDFWADCLPSNSTPAEVSCSCCTTCCLPDGTQCFEQ